MPRNPRCGRGRTSALLVAVVLVAGACSGDSERTGTEAVDRRHEGYVTEDVLGDVDVWSSIGQQRHLEGTRRITVPLRFDSVEPVRVTSIAVRSNLFEPLEPEAKRSILHAGRKVDVQVDLGAPRCDEVPDVGGRATALVDAAHGGGAVVPLELPIPTWLLVEVHERACARAALAAAVDIALGAADGRDGTVVATEVVLARRGSDDDIRLDRMSGSVILALRPVVDAAPLAVLESGDDEVRVRVEVTAARCDPHGLAGSQKTFVFPVWVAVGDGPAIYAELRPDPGLQAVLREAIEACIEGS